MTYAELCETVSVRMRTTELYTFNQFTIHNLQWSMSVVAKYDVDCPGMHEIDCVTSDGTKHAFTTFDTKDAADYIVNLCDKNCDTWDINTWYTSVLQRTNIQKQYRANFSHSGK